MLLLNQVLFSGPPAKTLQPELPPRAETRRRDTPHPITNKSRFLVEGVLWEGHNGVPGEQTLFGVEKREEQRERELTFFVVNSAGGHRLSQIQSFYLGYLYSLYKFLRNSFYEEKPVLEGEKLRACEVLSLVLAPMLPGLKPAPPRHRYPCRRRRGDWRRPDSRRSPNTPCCRGWRRSRPA